MKEKLLLIILLIPIFCFAINDTTKKVIPMKNEKQSIIIQNIQSKPTIDEEWYEKPYLGWAVSIFSILLTYSFTKKLTLNSNNRQAWINDTRTCIAELMAQAKMLNIEFQKEVKDEARQHELHEKVNLQRNKIRLLLNPKIDSNKKVLEALKEFVDVLDLHMLNMRAGQSFNNSDFMQKSDEVINQGQELLYLEWKKIVGKNWFKTLNR